MADLTTNFRVNQMALGERYNCPSAYEVTLMDMGKCAIVESKNIGNIKTIKELQIWVHISWGVNRGDI